MVKYILKYRKSLTTILVLAPLLIWFLCSELGQFSIEKEQPIAQDYCETVKVIKTEPDKNAANDLFKLKVEKSFFTASIDGITIQRNSYNQLDIEHFYIPQKPNKIYLFNCAYLI